MPETSRPLTAASVPVPFATTSPISVRSDAAIAGSSGRAASAARGGGSSTSLDGFHVPAPTAPATVAIASGLAVTLPCPMVAAARSVAPAASGMEPPNAASGSVGFASNPVAVAARFIAPSGSCSPSCRNAVLHEIANARPNDNDGSASPSKFRNARPSTVNVGGQVVSVAGVVPFARSAAVVTILNVDPGG